MKCIFCAAATTVLEVRHRHDGSVRRTRECFNMHRFTSLENAYLANTGRKPVGGHVARGKLVDLDERHKRIQADLRQGKLVAAVCERYGVSPRTVARIRALMVERNSKLAKRVRA